MADNASITILRNTKASIDAEPIKDGNILFTTDQANNGIYMDVGTTRIKIGGTVDVDAELSTTSTNPVQNKVITNSIESITNSIEAFFDIVRPVGSLYSTIDKTFNPNTAKGWHGKWERIKDCVIYASGDSDTIGSIVGSNTHKLTTSELPSHTHSIPALSGKTTNSGDHVHNAIELEGGIEGDNTYTTTQVLFATSSAGYTSIAVGGNETINIIGGDHTHTVTTNASTTGSQGSGTAIDMRTRRLNSIVWKRVS